jgi:hypothetical protein
MQLFLSNHSNHSKNHDYAVTLSYINAQFDQKGNV